MSERFLKFIPSDKAMWLVKKHPNAFVLLLFIAERARRYDGHIDGLSIGEAHIGDWESYGLSERQYRTAKEQLCQLNIIKILETNRNRKKATTGTTTIGTKVKLLNSDIWDINSECSDDRNDVRPTTDRRLTDDEQERIKKEKERKEDIYLARDASLNPASQAQPPNEISFSDLEKIIPFEIIQAFSEGNFEKVEEHFYEVSSKHKLYYRTYLSVIQSISKKSPKKFNKKTTKNQEENIKFSFELRKFENLTEVDFKSWKELFSAISIEQEIKKMVEWCLSNPSKIKIKKNCIKFISNWLSKSNEHAINIQAYRENKTTSPKIYDINELQKRKEEARKVVNSYNSKNYDMFVTEKGIEIKDRSYHSQTMLIIEFQHVNFNELIKHAILKYQFQKVA